MIYDALLRGIYDINTVNKNEVRNVGDKRKKKR